MEVWKLNVGAALAAIPWAYESQLKQLLQKGLEQLKFNEEVRMKIPGTWVHGVSTAATLEYKSVNTDHSIR